MDYNHKLSQLLRVAAPAANRQQNLAFKLKWLTGVRRIHPLFAAVLIKPTPRPFRSEPTMAREYIMRMRQFYDRQHRNKAIERVAALAV